VSAPSFPGTDALKRDTVYLSPTGTDTAASGTLESPFLTFAYARQFIKTGGKIYFLDGEYTGTLDVPSYATIESYNNLGATIIQNSGATALSFQDKVGITVNGFLIDAPGATDAAIKITSSQDITISSVEIKNCPRQGILITHGTSATTGTIIENCHIHDCGTNGLDHGIYIRTGGIIRGCNIHNITGYGVHAYDGSGDYTIERNYLHNNGAYGAGAMFGNAVIKNNVIRDNVSQSIRITYNALDVLCAHNTVDEIFAGSRSTDDPATWTIKNNLCLVSGLQTAADLTGVTIDADKNIILSGDYTDDGGANIKPSAGNPAKAAGIAIAGITTDYGGNARSDPPTIGAWE